jgi:hypothetical protein
MQYTFVNTVHTVHGTEQAYQRTMNTNFFLSDLPQRIPIYPIPSAYSVVLDIAKIRRDMEIRSRNAWVLIFVLAKA